MNRRKFFSMGFAGMVAAVCAPLMKGESASCPMSPGEKEAFWYRLRDSAGTIQPMQSRIGRVNDPIFYDYLLSQLRKVSHKLFLLKSRSGIFVFTAYDSPTGLPTTNEILFIFRQGEGYSKTLDGGVLHSDGNIHLEHGGWGYISVRIGGLNEIQTLGGVTDTVIAAGRKLLAA